MSLARAEGTFEALLLIAVAPTPEDRLRMASLIAQDVPVVVVASREEAVGLLLGDEPTRVTSIGLTVDSDLRTATYQGVSVPLSPLEHDLLRWLVREAGRTWPFEVLHREIWGTGHLGGLADVQSVVKRLRRKLRDLRCPIRISSVRGVGLRLDGRLRARLSAPGAHYARDMSGRFSGTTVVDRPIAEVFAFLAEGTNDPKFSPRVLSIRKEPEGASAVGTVFVSQVKDAGMKTDRRFELTEIVPPTRLRWVERSKNLVTAEGGYDLEDLGGAQTRVTIFNTLEGHGLGKLLVGFAVKAAAKDADAFAQRIKAAVEAG